MYTIRLTPFALQDLQDIKHYIAVDLENAQAANDTIKAIIQAYENLIDFPLIGAKVSNIIELPTDFRYLICKKLYRIL